MVFLLMHYKTHQLAGSSMEADYNWFHKFGDILAVQPRLAFRLILLFVAFLHCWRYMRLDFLCCCWGAVVSEGCESILVETVACCLVSFALGETLWDVVDVNSDVDHLSPDVKVPLHLGERLSDRNVLCSMSSPDLC